MTGFSLIMLCLFIINSLFFIVGLAWSEDIYKFLKGPFFIWCTVAYVLIVAFYFIVQKVIYEVEEY